jgi:hypothetical protein
MLALIDLRLNGVEFRWRDLALRHLIDYA